MPSLIELVHGNKDGVDKIIQSFLESYKVAEIPKSLLKRVILECAQRKRGELPLPKPLEEFASENVPVASAEFTESIPLSCDHPEHSVSMTTDCNKGEITVCENAETASVPTPTCIYFGAARWVVHASYLDKCCNQLRVSEFHISSVSVMFNKS